jgi:phosphopentomutase
VTQHLAPTRAIVLVLDGAGIGELPDAADYGDEGSNTIGNVARVAGLRVPTLARLGLSRVVDLGGGATVTAPAGAFGRMAEASPGKDSVTGHWELAGLRLDRPFPVFPHGFPPEILGPFEDRIGREALANKAASGTVIIDELGDLHVRTGQPIVYTSADSVFQIATHESVVPVDELYRWCEIAFEIACQAHGVGRVIARPFVGESGGYTRDSARRRDFALPPRGQTLLDRLTAAGVPVVAIGKIEDLFAGRGISRSTHTRSDAEGMHAVERELGATPSGLIFANLVDLDTVYGHRNDPAGYADNLERIDEGLARLLPQLTPRDVLVVTADHGNDPTTQSTDHSREYVPLLVTGASVRAVDLGVRPTFADLGQTLAELFGVERVAHGTSFLGDILTSGPVDRAAH